MKKINRQTIEVLTDVGKQVRISPRQYVKSFNLIKTGNGLIINMETLENVSFKKWWKFWK